MTLVDDDDCENPIGPFHLAIIFVNSDRFVRLIREVITVKKEVTLGKGLWHGVSFKRAFRIDACDFSVLVDTGSVIDWCDLLVCKKTVGA